MFVDNHDWVSYSRRLMPFTCFLFSQNKLEHAERSFFIISATLSVWNIPALTLCCDYNPQCVSGLVAFILEVEKWVTWPHVLLRDYNEHCIKQGNNSFKQWTQKLSVPNNTTTWCSANTSGQFCQLNEGSDAVFSSVRASSCSQQFNTILIPICKFANKSYFNSLLILKRTIQHHNNGVFLIV